MNTNVSANDIVLPRKHIAASKDFPRYIIIIRLSDTDRGVIIIGTIHYNDKIIKQQNHIQTHFSSNHT